MANLVSFQSLTAAEYEALSGEYVENRIYFITDSGKLMLNGNEYGGGGGSDAKPVPDYFYLEATSDNTAFGFWLNGSGSLTWPDLQYSKNGDSWEVYNNTSTILSANTGDVFRFKGYNGTSFSKDNLYVNLHIDSGSLAAGGNLMTLVNGTGEMTAVDPYTFYYFKSNENLDDKFSLANDFKFGASSGGARSFYQVLMYNSSITFLPDFSNILSGSIAAYELYSIVRGTSITTIPSFENVTEINEQGCAGMFQQCTALTSVDLNLNAQTYHTNAIRRLFRGCSNLTSITVHWTTWPVDVESSAPVTTEWLQYVANTGTFHCPAGLVIPSRDASGVPAGWTIETF